MGGADLNDIHWAPIRDAVPSFAPTWRITVSDADYTPALPFVTIGDFATHVIDHVVRQLPEELLALADTLEVEFAETDLLGNEEYAGLLRVGLLEGLITAADDRGLVLTRLAPLLRGPHTREHWEAAIAWLKPGFIWDEVQGLVALGPRARAVGTVEFHRARRLDDHRVAVDARLVSGDLSSARFVRQRNGKESWTERRLLSVRRRSDDVADEFELELHDELIQGSDGIWLHLLAIGRERYWQLADGPSVSAPGPPNDEL